MSNDTHLTVYAHDIKIGDLFLHGIFRVISVDVGMSTEIRGVEVPIAMSCPTYVTLTVNSQRRFDIIRPKKELPKMITVKEARINKVVEAMKNLPNPSGSFYPLKTTATAVVEALFTADPIIDNAMVKE
jgi:hypothetical protein